MDRSAFGRKRRLQAPLPPEPLLPATRDRDRRASPLKARRLPVGKTRSAGDARPPAAAAAAAATAPSDRPPPGDDPHARYFTVANVGAGGTLYLKPSRLPPHTVQPAAAAAASDPPRDGHDPEPAPPSAAERTTSPPRQAPRRAAHGPAIHLPPPVSLSNVQPKRRPRSHSFSTISERERERTRPPTLNSTDLHFLVSAPDSKPGARSSVDLTGGFLDLHIPHYRIGTPRFTDRGTAYLHNSTYSSVAGLEDTRSSAFSRTEYDKLFPMPPGRLHVRPPLSRDPSSSYLHPSVARYSSITPSRTPPTPRSKSPAEGEITPALYDRIEVSPDDPSLVRYNAATGKIVAATPARLVAQITSPAFLDYALLSDFFLTFRCFLSRSDLLEYLLARMQWAMDTSTDAGRIVRVRTFVAIRHWILNYFVDDFVADAGFRRRLCTLVNELAASLRQRPDHGGSDMKIVSELKKCWRRTCATFWPFPEAVDAPPDADITPGGEMSGAPEPDASRTSLALSLRRPASSVDFRRASAPLHITLENGPTEQAGRDSTGPAANRQTVVSMRKTSIPASPMSEQSLQVLSCSVPFLRHIRPSAKTHENNSIARPAAGPRKNQPLSSKPSRSSHQHKRSGSFSDALRDGRVPLPSMAADSVDIRSLPAITFTGGLVRGLLLQPSPPTVDVLIPITPGLESRDVNVSRADSSYFPERLGHNLGVKRFVGDVKRVLNSRKGHSESPTSSQISSHSSGSRSSSNLVPERQYQPSAWQRLRGPPRVDTLAARIAESYKEAFLDVNLPSPMNEPGPATPSAGRPDDVLEEPQSGHLRPESHVTAGSRSIVIMDDTGAPEVPLIPGVLPVFDPMTNRMTRGPYFGGMDGDLWADATQRDTGAGQPRMRAVSISSGNSWSGWRGSSDIPLHDFLMPEVWEAHEADDASDSLTAPSAEGQASSDVRPSGLDTPPIRHQLRRRPGGNLKSTEHVHELEPLPRPHTSDSSTVSHSRQSSQAIDLSGTQFSGDYFPAWRFPSHMAPDREQRSLSLLPTHSSQPNMRPSFEAQVSHLTRLPDGGYTSGGIEDALMKLEGKVSSPTASTWSGGAGGELPTLERQPSEQDPLHTPHISMPGAFSPTFEDPDAHSPSTTTRRAPTSHLSEPDAMDGHRLRSMGSSQTYDHSEAQDSAAAVPPHPSKAGDLPAQSPELPEAVVFADEATLQHDHMESLAKSDSAPKSSVQGSFLLDGNESLSDISTEIADQSDDESVGMRSFFFDETPRDDDVLPYPAGKPPPTPPSTTVASGEPSTTTDSGRLQLGDSKPPLKEAQSAPKLLSPNADRHVMKPHLAPLPTPPQQLDAQPTKMTSDSQRAGHMPFVLAFEAEVVAEQLTIIEKDALDEIDWKDLINLNWQHSPPQIRNWVDFLKNENCTGVDIVVARFNLMVKWVVSECVLTETVAERARCVVKFIHIAVCCHRFRNYASMYQLTLALLSTDLGRLHRTWALVPPAEMQKLEKLESLCQPARNFHNLRVEMEATTIDSGCIPFIGLYTHDLMFNAQKPVRIDPSPPGKEPLINFERFQAAATIIKSLLRLIEGSLKYVFHPHPEALSRCLWLAALDDSETNARIKAIEP